MAEFLIAWLTFSAGFIAGAWWRSLHSDNADSGAS